MKIIQYFKKLFKKVPIKNQVAEWYKTVPNLPKKNRDIAPFTCYKCGVEFLDSMARFERMDIDDKTGEYVSIILPNKQIFCYKCYPKLG